MQNSTVFDTNFSSYTIHFNMKKANQKSSKKVYRQKYNPSWDSDPKLKG